MAHVLSENAKLYYNSATYATPTWDLITEVKDLTLTFSKGEVDVTTRASGGYTEIVDGLKEASIEFSILYNTSDTDFSAILDAFHANTAVEFFVMDGLVATSGSEGLRATCTITGLTVNQVLGEALMADFTAKPLKNSDAAPTWTTIA
jgi:predicted secreted protein